MKLTEQDKQILLKCGHHKNDMDQLQEAASRCLYYDKDNNRITADEVIKKIGRKNWLYGISRAAFHWTAAREDNGFYISFNCSAMFK